MATRATILIKRNEEQYHIYHHYDGDPEGIGRDLKAYLKECSYWFPADIANDLVKGRVANDDGYKITMCQHGDEDYAYLIDCNEKILKCYKIGWDDYDLTDDKVVEIPD